MHLDPSEGNLFLLIAQEQIVTLSHFKQRNFRVSDAMQITSNIICGSFTLNLARNGSQIPNGITVQVVDDNLQLGSSNITVFRGDRQVAY